VRYRNPWPLLETAPMATVFALGILLLSYGVGSAIGGFSDRTITRFSTFWCFVWRKQNPGFQQTLRALSELEKCSPEIAAVVFPSLGSMADTEAISNLPSSNAVRQDAPEHAAFVRVRAAISTAKLYVWGSGNPLWKHLDEIEYDIMFKRDALLPILALLGGLAFRLNAVGRLTWPTIFWLALLGWLTLHRAFRTQITGKAGEDVNILRAYYLVKLIERNGTGSEPHFEEDDRNS
jgi:hypothetical protein